MSADTSLDLVFLWHMHQPDYRDPFSGEFRRPWVYLHAIKDYTDMAAHLERHPQIRAVVNFVPVLLDQIEDYIAQFDDLRFRDPLLRYLAMESLDAIGAPARRELIALCSPGNHERMLAPFPRFERLHALARHAEEQGDPDRLYLSGQYLADLVTWFHLVWSGETERRSAPLLAQLMSRGGHFSANERRQLLNWIGDTLRKLLPRYRALAARGQIELSTTPYAHPLAPLMIDFASAREALPEIALPASPQYPGGLTRVDAHIERAISAHALRFGEAASGVWPAEGALSEPFLARLADAGACWAASSESVLANSLRGENGDLPPREEWLYRPWQLETVPGLKLFFRDERLSDLIGFEYAKWHGRDAAEHFVFQLESIADAAPTGEVPLVSVMLDGENAWEYYPYNAYYFFDDLYHALAAQRRLRLRTLCEFQSDAEHAAQRLPHLVAGSWVYGNFATWIGDAAKNRAWDMLCEAKQAYDLIAQSGRLEADALALATRQLAACEGSDWFWWFGDYNPRAAVESFDRLFRENLAALYRRLGLPVPHALGTPISRGGGEVESGGIMRRAG